MRDDVWLRLKLDSIWNFLYNDVEKKNNVVIRFKGKWKNKLGHIKMLKNKDSEIAINKILMNERVPEYIIDLTIAHELAHYAHGFNSPLQRKYKHPHKGGVVNNELRKRGFGHFIKMEKVWMKKEWKKIIREEFNEELQLGLLRWR